MGKIKNNNKIVKIVLINVAVLFTFFISADLILGKYRIPYDFNLFRVRHPYYHHGMIANAEQYAAWGDHLYKIKTNSLGLIDSANYNVNVHTDNKRILIIGDSHSEGVGVEFRNTFTGILQKKLKPYNIEMLNAAAVSYSPKIHFLKVDYLLTKEKLKVDEVWAFIDISDLQNEIAYEKFEPEKINFLSNLKIKINNFLKNHSFTFYTLHTMRENKRVASFMSEMTQFDPRIVTNLEKNTVEIYEDFFRDFDNNDLLRSPQFHGVGEWYYDSAMIDLANKGLNLGQYHMSRLDSLCDAKNIKLRLSVHPWHSQIKKQDVTDFYVQSWEKFCSDKEIDFINLFPSFINGENPYSVIEKYYIPGDNHWNEAGHEQVADYLYESYLKKVSNNE